MMKEAKNALYLAKSLYISKDEKIAIIRAAIDKENALVKRVMESVESKGYKGSTLDKVARAGMNLCEDINNLVKCWQTLIGE